MNCGHTACRRSGIILARTSVRRHLLPHNQTATSDCQATSIPTSATLPCSSADTPPRKRLHLAATMALPNLRRIFSASRTPTQERAVSRQAFFRFVSFLASCVLIALLSSPRRRAVLLGAIASSPSQA